ncbi:MAG: acetate--CoA ligase family protein [Burkholderiaceae bacterium]
MRIFRNSEGGSPSAGSVRAWLAEARRSGRTALPEPLAKQVLGRYGIRTPEGRYVEWLADGAQALRQAAQIARELKPPLVLKLVAPEVLHKSDFGGVLLGLDGGDEVQAAMVRMAESVQARGLALDGFLIEETVPRGHDLVIGGFRDESFGPVVMVGLGGVFVELLQDVAFRICPITRADAEEMLAELKGAPLLRGARGGLAIDPATVIDVLLAVGGDKGLLLDLADELAELDINPLMAGAGGAVAADARMVLHRGSEPGQAAARARPSVPLEALFEPRAVAVAGASGSGTAQGNKFIRGLRAAGYRGAIYPIHPSERELEGLTAYRDLASTPQPIDYAFVAIPAMHVPALLAGANGRVRIAQVMTSGFDEAPASVPSPVDGALVSRREALELAIRRGGMRVLGPNCMGTHSPRGRMSFIEEGIDEPGGVGVLSQSGGLSMDIIRRGRQRGLRFSAVVSVGNCLDLDPADLLGFYLNDPHTRVIGAYLEHLQDGRRFFELLRQARARKPVVLLKGGRSAQGQRAAASHTGSLAGNDQVWRALAAQTGSILVDDLTQFIDTLTAFQAGAAGGHAEGVEGVAGVEGVDADERRSQVVMFGNGGGASVLAADALARSGVPIGPLQPATALALEALEVPAGASLDNPIDVPANVLQRESGALAERILQTVCRHELPQALIVHLNLPVILGYRHVDMLGDLVRAVMRVKQGLPAAVPVLLALRSSGDPQYEEKRRHWAVEAARSGIAVFEDLPNAAQALAALLAHARFRAAQARARP